MKKIYILPILLVFLCNMMCKNLKIKNEPQIKDNFEIKNIYDTDQSERQSENIDWKVVSKNDSLRQNRIYQLLKENKVSTSKDYHNAAMIFQHGKDSVAYKMAVDLMKKSVELDSNANKWLLAAAIDRYLLSKNEPQIYGTQFEKHGLDDPWFLSKIDTTKISDEERIKYGVGTLAQQREKVKLMNKKTQ